MDWFYPDLFANTSYSEFLNSQYKKQDVGTPGVLQCMEFIQAGHNLLLTLADFQLILKFICSLLQDFEKLGKNVHLKEHPAFYIPIFQQQAMQNPASSIQILFQVIQTKSCPNLKRF